MRQDDLLNECQQYQSYNNIKPKIIIGYITMNDMIYLQNLDYRNNINKNRFGKGDRFLFMGYETEIAQFDFGYILK